MHSEKKSAPLADHHNCPQCGSSIPRYPHYSTWCDVCEWNLQPAPSNQVRSAFNQKLAQLATHIDDNRFQEVIKNKHNLKRFTTAQFFGLTLASIIYIVHAIIFSFLIWQFLSANLLLFRLISLAAAVGIGWVVYPRFSSLAQHHVVDPQEFPALHATVHRVADVLEVEVAEIVLTPAFTATFGRVGVRQKPMLMLGHPFISLLSPPELVSLIAHELSHGSDGAWTRSLYVRTALETVRRWQRLIAPSSRWMQFFQAASVPMQLLCVVPMCLLTLAALPFGTIAALLELCSFQDSQRSEYIADAQSIAIGGNRSTIMLLKKSYYQYLDALVIRYRRTPAAHKYTQLIKQLKQIPQREVDRVWRIAQQEQALLRSTHPSLQSRLAFLQSFDAQEPMVMISAETFHQLQKELAKWPLIISDDQNGPQATYVPSAAD